MAIGGVRGENDFHYGFLIDSARATESRTYYRRLIDFVAGRGVHTLLWHFTDDQGCSLQFDTDPEIASPNAYSKAEMRELIRYASDRGIELVPELASLGHCRFLTRLPAYQHLNETDHHFSGMCPVHPQTRDLIGKLLAEVAEVFDSPSIHVGLDEVNIGEHPLTREALKSATHGELMTDYVRFVHGIVTGLGKRMWMWGDGVLKHEEMLAGLPRDIVICNWQYAPDVTDDSTRTLLTAGFDVLLCSGLITFDQTLSPGERFAIPNVRALQNQLNHLAPSPSILREGRGEGEFERGKSFLSGSDRTPKILGHLATIWTPVRFLAESLWPSLDLICGIFEHGSHIDVDARLREFATDYFGLINDDLDRYADVVQTLLQYSPLRPEWLAVLHVDDLKRTTLKAVRSSAAAWTKAARQVAVLSPMVRRHRAEFDAFGLLIDLLAGVYDAAVKVADDAPPESLSRLASRARTLADRIDAQWDLERSADDSRKFTAPVATFQPDHLVPLIHQWADEIGKRAAAQVLQPLGST